MAAGSSYLKATGKITLSEKKPGYISAFFALLKGEMLR